MCQKLHHHFLRPVAELLHWFQRNSSLKQFEEPETAGAGAALHLASGLAPGCSELGGAYFETSYEQAKNKNRQRRNIFLAHTIFGLHVKVEGGHHSAQTREKPNAGKTPAGSLSVICNCSSESRSFRIENQQGNTFIFVLLARGAESVCLAQERGRDGACSKKRVACRCCPEARESCLSQQQSKWDRHTL